METTREQWLQAAVDQLRPLFEHHKIKLPEKVAVACGWPSKGGLSQEKPRLGECWPSEATFDGIRQIFVTPRVNEPVKVLGILVHELVHSAMPDDEKHGPRFKAAMKEIGLTGRPTATMPDADLDVRLQQIAEELGAYPNSAISVDIKPKDAPKKATFKCFCANKREANNKCRITDKNIGKDYTVSVGRKMLELGFPQCPCG